MSLTATSEEREQINALKAHQRTVRGHKAAKARVTAAAEALTNAEQDHSVAKAEREEAKQNLLVTLQDI